MEPGEDGLIPSSMIRQYYFCQQIPYINYVLHIVEPETESMATSRASHDVFRVQRIPRRYRPLKVITKVFLKSGRLKLKGVVDAIVETELNELIPCELKLSSSYKGRPHRKDRLQLVANAMLVEENYLRPVKRGLIYYMGSGEKVEVLITASDRYLVTSAVRRILQMVECEEAPIGRNLRNCAQCWYKFVCRTA